MGRSKQQTAPFGISPHAFMTLVSPTLGHDLALAFLQWIEAGDRRRVFIELYEADDIHLGYLPD